jgi:hypothetical protein
MHTNSFTPAQLHHLIEAQQKKYEKAIETDKEFEKAKTIFLKIKEYKKVLDGLENINSEPSQYLHSR